MKCKFRDFRYNTNEDADARRLLWERSCSCLASIYRPNIAMIKPTPSLSVQPATKRRKPEKFPRPTEGVDESRKRWDNFRLNWTQYKKDFDLRGADVNRHLVA